MSAAARSLGLAFALGVADLRADHGPARTVPGPVLAAAATTTALAGAVTDRLLNTPRGPDPRSRPSGPNSAGTGAATPVTAVTSTPQRTTQATRHV